MPKETKPVKIGDKLVGPGQPTFIVAEIGINHTGIPSVAKKMIDLAVESGVDAVKFQTRTVDVVYKPEELAQARQVPETILLNALRREVLPPEAVRRLKDSNFEKSTNGDLKRLLEFTDNEYQELDRYCREKGVMWFTACWDVESLERMERLFPEMPVVAHKIASPCNQDRALLRRARASGKPIIMSTGMSQLKTLRAAVDMIGTENLVLMHCKSIYSTGVEFGEEMLRKLNLRAIDTLRETFAVPVGFSSHDSGIMPTYAAVARGANIVEKHITLERGMWGSDQGWSTDPVDWPRLCQAIRELELVLGDGRIIFDPEEEVAEKKLRRVRWEDGE